MNYQAHYDRLIDRAKARILDGYVEVHHIIPKCLGGSNQPDNLVKLTAREHFVAHQLLVKLNPENKKLRYAALMMTVSSKFNNRVNNRKYGWIKEFDRSGHKHSEETKKKMSETRKGKKRGEAFSEKMSQVLTGRTLPEGTKNKISATLTGRKLTEEQLKSRIGKPLSESHKKSLSIAGKGRKRSEETKAKMKAAALLREQKKREKRV